jgi:hypothetical protein
LTSRNESEIKIAGKNSDQQNIQEWERLVLKILSIVMNLSNSNMGGMLYNQIARDRTKKKTFSQPHAKGIWSDPIEPEQNQSMTRSLNIIGGNSCSGSENEHSFDAENKSDTSFDDEDDFDDNYENFWTCMNEWKK